MLPRAYLSIEEIPGESLQAGHEETIEIHGLQWGVAQQQGETVGRGRARARTIINDVELTKITDAASVYLIQACLKRTSLSKATLTFRSLGTDTVQDYLVITMTNVIVSGVELDQPPSDINRKPTETVRLAFEEMKVLYTDFTGTTTAEHEIAFDRVAGF